MKAPLSVLQGPRKRLEVNEEEEEARAPTCARLRVGVRVLGLRVRVWGVEGRVSGLGFKVWGLGLRVWVYVGFQDKGLEFGV